MAITPVQSVRRGLRVGDGIMQFDFKPSVGIAAGAIDKLGLDIRSFREPLKRVVQEVMAPSFRQNFASGGRPDNWEPLSDATLEIKERLGKSGGSNPLIGTGLLQRTMGQLNIWTITTETATLRDLPQKIWYGKVHQEGYGGSGASQKMSTRMKLTGSASAAMASLDDDLIDSMRTGKKMGGARGAAPIPARPFVMIQDEDYDKIEQVFEDWLEGRLLRTKAVFR